MRCKVLRAFLHRGKAQPVGSVIDLPKSVAIELRHIGKLEILPDAPSVPPVAPPAAPAADHAGKKPAKTAATSGPMTTVGSALVAGATTKDSAP